MICPDTLAQGLVLVRAHPYRGAAANTLILSAFATYTSRGVPLLVNPTSQFEDCYLGAVAKQFPTATSATLFVPCVGVSVGTRTIVTTSSSSSDSSLSSSSSGALPLAKPRGRRGHHRQAPVRRQHGLGDAGLGLATCPPGPLFLTFASPHLSSPLAAARRPTIIAPKAKHIWRPTRLPVGRSLTHLRLRAGHLRRHRGYAFQPACLERHACVFGPRCSERRPRAHRWRPWRGYKEGAASKGAKAASVRNGAAVPKGQDTTVAGSEDQDVASLKAHKVAMDKEKDKGVPASQASGSRGTA